MPNEAMSLDDIFPLDQFAEISKIPFATLRSQLMRRESNGLAQATVMVGRHIYVSKSRYETWLASRAGLATRAGAGPKGPRNARKVAR